MVVELLVRELGSMVRSMGLGRLELGLGLGLELELGLA